MIDEPVKRVIDHSAAGATALTTVAYYAEQLTPIFTCATALLAMIWYIVRFFDRWMGRKSGAGE